MRINKLVCSVTALLATLAVPVRMIAQDGQVPTQNHRHYKLIDIGTFGGPNSTFVLPSPGGRLLNNSGAAAGGADTSSPDPSSCLNFDCYLSYGFKWQDGVANKLSALPGFNSSFTFWISDTGLAAGLSENGIDPLTGSLAQEAILWGNDGSLTDLGTLGGNDSVAGAVNNRAQVAGGALNTIPDPYTSNFFISGATQVHAFRWTKSQGMQDLGTLGGTDSNAFEINNRGQIAGWSFTNSTVNPVTGIPNLDPFLWENGKLLDLGTLGGTVALSYALNNRGQVSGRSNMAGDLTCHPFLWDQNRGMQDLGTLGGDSGFATWLNDAGEVVGVANLPGVSGCDGAAPHHAFLWKKGLMTDLGTADGDPCSYAVGINSKGQVVGSSTDCTNYVHASLWEDGGPMVDLNSLIPSNSGVQLTLALYINDRGEIAAHGTLSNGDQHAFLLIPCGLGDDDAECSAQGGDSTLAPQMNLGAGREPHLQQVRVPADRPQRGLTENKN
jgi:probable HAF family extracellular repeat protein